MAVYCLNVKSNNAWNDVLNAARITIGSTPTNREPSSMWKTAILQAEHSPIRLLEITWDWIIPYWVSVHFVRHHEGIHHFVSSQRSQEQRDNRPQGALVRHRCVANAQAILNISKVRLCHRAAIETRSAWQGMIDDLIHIEPELASLCVPSCIYRGGSCPEGKFSCRGNK
jgi:hypothetical protein